VKVDHDDSVAALVDTSVAIAQTAGSPNPAAPPSTNPDNQLMLNSAPVGHSQPRVDQVPSENAALDRMIKGICRGC
jgi:hypothetical protein